MNIIKQRQKIKETQNININPPSIPKSQKIRGGFEKLLKKSSAILNYCFYSVIVVDSSLCLEILGKVGEFTHMEPLGVKKAPG